MGIVQICVANFINALQLLSCVVHPHPFHHLKLLSGVPLTHAASLLVLL
jgi:hypothetical protein